MSRAHHAIVLVMDEAYTKEQQRQSEWWIVWNGSENRNKNSSFCVCVWASRQGEKIILKIAQQQTTLTKDNNETWKQEFKFYQQKKIKEEEHLWRKKKRKSWKL